MKSVIASMVAVAGLSVAAVAEVNTRFDVLVSTDGINFSHHVDARAGDTIQVLVTASYIGTGPAIGLGSAVIQPTVTGFSSLDTVLPFASRTGLPGQEGVSGNAFTPNGLVQNESGQYGKISPWGRTSAGSTSGTGAATASQLWSHTNLPGTLRIAQRQTTAAVGTGTNTNGNLGVVIAQNNDFLRNANTPAYEGGLTNVALLRFAFTLDSDQATEGVRPDLHVTIPANGIGNYASSASAGGSPAAWDDVAAGDRTVNWFQSMLESSASIKGTAIVEGSSISVVPSPASLALLGLGGLCVARRRR